jgi:DNA polymerase (family 10)
MLDMTNQEIAKTFQYLGKIMELHGENPFKIRSYQNAYMTLRKLDKPLSEYEPAELEKIKGVGKAISSKINELLETGKMATLQKYEEKTPEGIRELLHIKGFGPKKIGVVWKDLGVESVGELLYAVNENRLIELKGFGLKTQEDLKGKLEYYLKSKGQYHYATLEEESGRLLSLWQKKFPNLRVETSGALRRKEIILEQIELLADPAFQDLTAEETGISVSEKGSGFRTGRTENDLPVRMYFSDPGRWGLSQFEWTGDAAFRESFSAQYGSPNEAREEKQIFERANLPYIVPELRSGDWALERAAENRLPEPLSADQIRGVVHAHSTWSDGLNSIEEMAEAAREEGYEYLGLTDHSRSAFYANGLSEERIRQQWEEIDTLNLKWTDFRIFKGIESDILNDGSLDYEDELLAQFDFVIASVHSNLRMDEAKATQRLIRAVENPYTTILGHPTGRLLLSRPGYPIDHRAVIDACAEKGVAIELNASPYRLDLDWSWIPYAQEKDVLISINPDAHSRAGIEDIQFGVAAARKGGLDAEGCLNTRSKEEFEAWIRKKA